MSIYNCYKKILCPMSNFIKNNFSEEYKESIQVDECLADEIEGLWIKGIRTTGCCCGHGKVLGFIGVQKEDISKMEDLGYVHYIYSEELGGAERKDAFIPKAYGHIYKGYSNGFWG